MHKITCPKCGKVNTEESKYCAKCKAVMTVPEKEAKPHTRIVEAGFTRHVHEASAPEFKPKPEIFAAEVKHGAGVFGKVIVAVLVIAVLGAGFLYYAKKQDLFTKAKACLKYCEGDTVIVTVPKDSFIPFCQNIEDVKLFYHSFDIGDKFEINNLLKDKRMLSLDYDTGLLVIDKHMLYARVRVLDGALKGLAGWVNLLEILQFDQRNNIVKIKPNPAHK